MMQILGPHDRLLSTIEAEHPGVAVHVRGNEVVLRGDPDEVAVAERLVRELASLTAHGVSVDPGELTGPGRIIGEAIVTSRGRAVRPKTLGQKRYVDGIDVNTITFGIGPAGTGKTYLAMAKAVQAFQQGMIRKIVLTRPAVEAGERLGFLPGTLSEKIDPYLRPLLDALGDMLEPELVVKLMNTGVVEVAPLAYMRGRTLNDAFVILDEAQNTTREQMKMFLTRLGFGTKLVITGDVTQVDLRGTDSGLQHARTILAGIPDIHFADLTSDDIVRHSLVAHIVDAYDRSGDTHSATNTPGSAA